MKLLLIHQNLPAQFKHLIARYASNPKHEVVGICQGYAPAVKDLDNNQCVLRIYEPRRKPTKDTHNYLYSQEAAVLNGQAVAAEVHRLEREGFVPDITLAHTGWGEALYIKDVLPDSPLVGFLEFFYRARGLDADFDPEFAISKDDELRIRTRNAIHLLSLEACDAGISPTAWQKSVHPPQFHSKIEVLHEGIDTREVAPDIEATFELPNAQTLTREHEVITYISRGLEPYRGFHAFMRAVPEICRRRPNCHIVIAGSDDVNYGRKLPPGETWRERMLQEVEIDSTRVHFLGPIPWKTHVRLLQVSRVHVYLTVPFVLSWSILEAMAAGSVVIGSDTPPVREVIEHGKNGLLVDFFSKDALIDAIDDMFEHPRTRQSLAAAGRKTIVSRYDVRDALARYHQFLSSMTKGYQASALV